MSPLPECDWKYLQSIRAGLLEELSRRINDAIRNELARTDVSESEKRRNVYGIVTDKKKIVADCFDYWSREHFFDKCWCLFGNNILTLEHIKNFTPETQRLLLPTPRTNQS